ncbi:hypothetical protein [Streptomyces angustmyceticus]|uniref:Uncharacterized protein n=1 Tax=Streptomyces angustmyceticus TaxID=285578 RepID=A0A5J4LH88_9ACTN|nr:hypothetical protein San01_60350 [Streptomyces angustmyceticus]
MTTMSELPLSPSAAPSTDPGFELRSEITVELVDHSASDIGVVRAARVSTAGDPRRVQRVRPGQPVTPPRARHGHEESA